MINIKFKFNKIDDSFNYKCEIYNGDKPISKEDLFKAKDQWEEIAKKNPLNAIALIQKLAMEGDLESAFIQCVYQTYKQFLKNGETSSFERLANLILSRANKPSLKKQIAEYIKTVLEGEEVKDLKLLETKEVLHYLMPGFEETLLTDAHKVHEEQLIETSLMKATHNAFPDLFKFNNEYYIAFREAESHVGYQDLGKIVILKGNYDKLSKTWKFEDHATLSDPDYDLRDPRFFVNEDGCLMLIIGGSKISKKDTATKMVPHVASFNGKAWKMEKVTFDAAKPLKKGQWIWRVTWNPHDHHGYALSYGASKKLALLKTTDGLHFTKLMNLSTDKLDEPFNEATLRFKEDGTMVALIRTQKHGLIGTSTLKSGYKTWEFELLPFRLGGPNFLIRPNGEMVAGTRYFFLNQDNTLDLGTVVASMNEKSLNPLIRLKSEQDNSYPGMVLEKDGEISFLYYSSDLEGASRLMMTRVFL